MYVPTRTFYYITSEHTVKKEEGRLFVEVDEVELLVDGISYFKQTQRSEIILTCCPALMHFNF